MTDPSGDGAIVRGRLLERYRSAFACEWDVTPWGEHWMTLLDSARAADEEHARAVSALRALQTSLTRVKNLAEEYGAVPNDQPIQEAMVGRTLADALVVALLAKHECAFSDLSTDLDDSLQTLASPAPGYGLASEESSVAQNRTHLLSGTEPVLEEEAGRMPVGTYPQAFHASRNRRLRNCEVRLLLAEDGPTPFGPPAPFDVTTWTRAYIVELLDGYPVRPATASGLWSVPTDSDIAVVSLLAVPFAKRASVLSVGFAAALRAECNAVAAVRRPRPPLAARDADVG